MFNQSQRMNSREFTLLYSRGKKYFSSFFRIVIGGDVFKVSIVIPKKKLKKRIDRNREKRRIAHALKKVFGETYPQAGIIIFLQKDTTELSFTQLTAELQQLVKKTDM